MLGTVYKSRRRVLYSASKTARAIRPPTFSQLHGCRDTPPPAAPKVIFSGIQPTGVPHLGNYLGALRPWVRLQDEASPDTILLFSIVDLHALTIRQGREQLQRWKQETLGTLLAVGLDPRRSVIFFQSDVCLTRYRSCVYSKAYGGGLTVSGICTYGNDVDIKLYSFNGLFVSNDSMEGTLFYKLPPLSSVEYILTNAE